MTTKSYKAKLPDELSFGIEVNLQIVERNSLPGGELCEQIILIWEEKGQVGRRVEKGEQLRR